MPADRSHAGYWVRPMTVQGDLLGQQAVLGTGRSRGTRRGAKAMLELESTRAVVDESEKSG